jgi:hypothetical protein
MGKALSPADPPPACLLTLCRRAARAQFRRQEIEAAGGLQPVAQESWRYALR